MIRIDPAGVPLVGSVLLLPLSTLLVLLMCVGIWLFYSHTAQSPRRATMTAGVVVVFWVLLGYGLAFGPTAIPGFLGDPLALLGSGGLGTGGGTGVAQGPWFAVFQCAVALLTVTIASSAVGDRVGRLPWLLFVAIWLIVGYSPVAYSVFNLAGGWLFGGLQINDQAGGTVVHTAAAAAALALLLVLRRRGHTQPGKGSHPPVALWRSVCGACAIWLGAFGLGAGSEAVLDGVVGTILVNTLIAPAAAAVSWSVIELIMTGRLRLRGAAGGIVAGVVAITPACNILTPAWTLVLGVLAGAICAAVVTVSRRSRLGGGVEVVGIHLAGGVLGLVYIGVLGNGIGWKDSGQPDMIAAQLGAALGVALWSFLVAIVIAWLLRKMLVPAGELSHPREIKLSSRS